MSWEFVIVAGPFGGTTEGPVWDGDSILFTHIPESKIYKYNPVSRASTLFRDGTNNANGLTYDSNGNLYACEGGARRVVGYTGCETVVIAEEFERNKLNIPNDLAADSVGNIWFTDPFYEGAGGDWSQDISNKELSHDSVYRIGVVDGSENMIRRMTFDTTRPNGILFSLDYKTLYVAQSGRLPEEKRELRAYPVLSDGTLGSYDVLHDFGEHRGVDGMVLNTEGNIVACAGLAESGPGPMIYVFSPEGEVVETHSTPVDRPTNCTFGGAELSDLYVTNSEGYLFTTKTNMTGRVNCPGSQ